jgi:hypothetical protein
MLMLRKTLLSLALGATLSFGAYAAEVIVRVAPPHAIIEHRVVSPGPNYVWVGGYHRWDGRAYIWVPGRWELAPRPHARWVAHHWVRRHGGWVLVEGRWR